MKTDITDYQIMGLSRRTFIISIPALLGACTFRHPVPGGEVGDSPLPLKNPPQNQMTRRNVLVRTEKTQYNNDEDFTPSSGTRTLKPSKSPTKTLKSVKDKAKSTSRSTIKIDPYYADIYGAKRDGGFHVAAIDLSRINPDLWRREVDYTGNYSAGTIVVDPNNFHCYFVLGNGRAIRYGVGVARTNATDFQGEATIGRKAAWPSWRPTDNMIRKQPQRYGHLSKGMAGGPNNPLGARALYLYRNGNDTLFRLHGTNEPTSIGKRVSSGCIRFLNQDIIDLYSRVTTGAKAIVLPHRNSSL